MIIHSVYFWLRSGCPGDLREGMLPALRNLAGIPGVRRLAAGSPAAVTARPVLDDTYHFALILEVDDADALAAYQADPVHQEFLARFSGEWERVRVFDVEV